MAQWGDKKYGGFKWGHSVPAGSTNALLRAVVGGNNQWLPTPSPGAPNGGDPTTGAAVYRHAVTHVYLLDSDWNHITEFVGIVDGTCTRTLSGPIQQDSLSLTMWDPTDFYTNGAGRLLLDDGNLVQVVMEIKSPGGVVTAPLGVYRLMGFPSVKRTKVGTELTINGVEWWRPMLSNPYAVTACPQPPPIYEAISSGGDSDFSSPAWPTNSSNLADSLLGVTTCNEDFIAWATNEFIAQRYQDFDDGHGPQPIWLGGQNTMVSAALWLMLDISLHPERLVMDRNTKDPFGGFFNGKPSETTSLGPEFLIKTPEWRDTLGQLNTYAPFWMVAGGNGVVHVRNPGGRYVTPFVVSCKATTGGTIPLPVEEIDHTDGQPEFTETLTYTQINPTVGTPSGKVIYPGQFKLRSVANVPRRYSKFGARREVVIYDTFNPPPFVETGGHVMGPYVVPPPWVDDGTTIPRMLEVMRSANSVSLTMDSAFPYIKLGDEIRVSMPGIKGYFTVMSITQPFNTSAMTISASWRGDG